MIQLFLAVPYSTQKASYLTRGDVYLTPLMFKGKNYLGKPLEGTPTLSDLENLEANLLSLLHKLDPNAHFPLPRLLTLHG